jgi:fumarate hydratase subunit alpha
MPIIHTDKITETVAKLCMDANYYLNADIKGCLANSLKTETNETAKWITGILIENAEIGKASKMPICQDTGMAVVFIDIGQDVSVKGEFLEDAVNAGVRKGYKDGYLGGSVVRDPIDRVNTNDNTPAVIHYNIVKGGNITITVVPKGFGSENMSALKMLKPAEGIDGVRAFVVDTVKKAGSNPCPPIIVGVGIGGTMEGAALLAKKALLRDVGTKNSNEFWADTEAQLLGDINALGIGVNGVGGSLTAMAVNINVYPTHIAGLPVAVNIGCHATRHMTAVLEGEWW